MKKLQVLWACTVVFLGMVIPVLAARAGEPPEVAEAKAKTWKPIPMGYFGDSIHHALMGFKERKAPYPQHTPEQIVHIAENLLAWQNPNGGWPKNKDWTKVLSDKEQSGLPGRTGRATRGHSTFDNRTTWSQVDYLARVHHQAQLARYADAAVRGIRYILSQQRSTGGWRGSDVDAITFNDDVMRGILTVLKDIAEDAEHYAFVEKPLRERVKAAFEKGLDCVLKCQIKVGNRLTAWCQQHHHANFRPVWARSYEPPSIVTAESVGVVRLLMSIDNPSPEIIQSVQAAVAWFDRVKIHGLRIKRVKMKPVKHWLHWTDYDNVEVKDPDAPPIWARFYHLRTEEPIFCTRARKITDDYTDLSRERRTGYSWYGYYPAKLLAEYYPKWQKRWAPDQNVLEQEPES
jgi:PelA/Pel-15E family pectate lyase